MTIGIYIIGEPLKIVNFYEIGIISYQRRPKPELHEGVLR